MIMGKLVRHGNGWNFLAIGEGASTQRIDDTIRLVQEKYL
jgi:tellurium resistance protein TerZ